MNENIEHQVERGSNHVVYDVVASAFFSKYDDVLLFFLTNAVLWMGGWVVLWLGGRVVVQCAAGDMEDSRQLRWVTAVRRR